MDTDIAKEVRELRREVSCLRRGRETQNIKLFALADSHDYGLQVAEYLGVPLSRHMEKKFPDGECLVHPLVNVRRSHVYLICNLVGDAKESVNDKMIKVLTFLGAAVKASADEATAVIRYAGYQRSDRKVRPRQPVMTQQLAMQFEAVGCTGILTMDPHNLGAFQNAHRHCRADHLEFRPIVIDYLRDELSEFKPDDVCFLSPDSGGMSRSRYARTSLERKLGQGIALSFFDKEHDDDEIRGNNIVGPTRPVMIIIDDMISSGRTMRLAADAAKEKGADRVYVIATHGLFVGGCNENMRSDSIHKIVISDTIPVTRLEEENKKKLAVVSTVSLFGEAINRTYTGDSLSSLFG